jgi:hypothetical protein
MPRLDLALDLKRVRTWSWYLSSSRPRVSAHTWITPAFPWDPSRLARFTGGNGNTATANTDGCSAKAEFGDNQTDLC